MMITIFSDFLRGIRVAIALTRYPKFPPSKKNKGPQHAISGPRKMVQKVNKIVLRRVQSSVPFQGKIERGGT